MRKKLLFILCSVLIACYSFAQAAVNLELTQGVNGALPIAIVPFKINGQTPPVDFVGVIQNDLQNSGRFSVLDNGELIQTPHALNEINYGYWRKLKANNIVIGRIESLSQNQYRVQASLIDVYQANPNGGTPVMFDQVFTVPVQNMRALAHHVSDLIYKQLIGKPGVFSTRIAYILVKRPVAQPPQYVLEVADVDGYHPRPLLVSNEPIMSPSWSPDGKKIVYVSFEKKRSQIYVTEVTTGRRQLISSFSGINGAPAWSPDGRQLALVLSKTGLPQLYTLDLQSGRLQRVLESDAIDTEPSWSPDGKSLVFTSSRGGQPQVYRLTLRSGQVERVTYKGSYNARASFSRDGSELVVLHRDGGLFNVAVQDVSSGALRSLTQAGLDESPSFAPNGDLILYATQYGGRGVLGVVSSDGRVKLRLPARDGNVQEPAWSPFLS